MSACPIDPLRRVAAAAENVGGLWRPPAICSRGIPANGDRRAAVLRRRSKTIALCRAGPALSSVAAGLFSRGNGQRANMAPLGDCCRVRRRAAAGAICQPDEAGRGQRSGDIPHCRHHDSGCRGSQPQRRLDGRRRDRLDRGGSPSRGPCARPGAPRDGARSSRSASSASASRCGRPRSRRAVWNRAEP